MKKIDLHTHSKISDGSMQPEELVVHAADRGLAAVALTDHDTVAGLDRALYAAKNYNIEVIPGIELSAWNGSVEVHIVGLFIDHHNPSFLEQIHTVSHARELRNLEMIQVMQKHGIDITSEKLAISEGSGILTRANFASYLQKTSVVKTYQEAFDKYLEKGKPFYIPRKKLTPEAAIKAIKTAGGIPILAHPLLYKYSAYELDQCVGHLKELGIQGLEVYYSRNRGTDDPRMRVLADKYGLVYSGGSDFHGSYKPDIEIGTGTGSLFVPYDVLEKLKALHAQNHE